MGSPVLAEMTCAHETLTWYAGMGVTLQHLEKLLKPHSRRYTVPGCEPDQQAGPMIDAGSLHGVESMPDTAAMH